MKQSKICTFHQEKKKLNKDALVIFMQSNLRFSENFYFKINYLPEKKAKQRQMKQIKMDVHMHASTLGFIHDIIYLILQYILHIRKKN